MVLLAWGHSHRTTADGELIRWGADVGRVEGRLSTRSGGPPEIEPSPATATATAFEPALEVALVRPGSAAAAAGGRKRIRVNGVPRRPSALGEQLRVVVFAP